MGALFGGNSNRDVDTRQNLNPNLTKAVNHQADQGAISQDDIVNRSLEHVGAPQAAGLPTPQVMAQQSAGLGGNTDAGMETALANRQNKLFSSHINQLQQIAKMNAPTIQAAQQSQGMQAMASQEELNNQMINTQMVKAQNDEAQRNAVLNSVLSLGGAIAGGFMGGPGGIAKGANLGSAAGGFLTGGNTQQQGLDTSGNGAMNYFGRK